MNDKRKYPRVNIRVLASFDCYDEGGDLFYQKLGVILDVNSLLGGINTLNNSMLAEYRIQSKRSGLGMIKNFWDFSSFFVRSKAVFGY